MVDEQAANLPRLDAQLPPVRQGLGSGDGEMCNGNRARDLRGAMRYAHEDRSPSDVAASGARGSPSMGVSAATGRVLGRGDKPWEPKGLETSLLHRIFIVVLDSATATSFSFSTSHSSFVIVVTAPSPLHPCKFKPKILLLWFLVVVPQIYRFVHACLLGFGL
ncbi:uncharacterized protein DS421_19g643400 [Arachis hypogaea]|uniref:Uncharacterized protein n=1 Tax=Arachis hypogaea TaxID=3818 RepID=A0A6B9V6T3_ARAHY|nr:uncharacterized protein DS421_19g643400 [Arachis hypogaea]